MTGPEHYAEAERLLDLAANTVGDSRYGPVQIAQWTAEAQVHASLALVAVTAESTQSQMFTMKPEWASTLQAEVSP